MDSFKDKIAIVTGSAAGIGRGLAEELARDGATVVIADINFDKAKKTAEAICASGGKAVAKKLDVTKAEQVEKVINDTVSEHGRLDYMINNAGIALLGEIKDMIHDQYKQLIDVNIMGVVNGSSIAYAQMLKQGFGHIVNVGSITGLFTFPIQTHYSATKHFVQGFSLGLRAEAVAYGVNVSVICPMNIKSDMVEGSITIVGSRNVEWFKNLPVKWMDTNQAARIMLKAVARNKAIIVVPSGAKKIWWFFRFSPGIFNFIAAKAMDKMRKM